MQRQNKQKPVVSQTQKKQKVAPQKTARQQPPRQQKRTQRDRSKNAETGADKLVAEAGQRGTDIRSPKRDVPEGRLDTLVPAGVLNVIPVTATVYDRAISYFALGIVLKAMHHGYNWKDNTGTITPYGSYLRIIAVVKAAMEGSAPLIQQAPDWFWVLLQGLKQKIVSFKTGRIKYDWQMVDSGQGDGNALNLGAPSTPESYVVFWGRTGLTTQTVNGIPIITPVSPTEQDQIDSLADLFAWFVTRMSSKMVEEAEAPKYMLNDSSAFAASYPTFGNSFFSPGGVRTDLFSERQIDSPVMAKFAQWNPENTPGYRGNQKYHTSGGSSCYLGARICELRTLDDWRNKTCPIIRLYNFDEFFNVWSLTLGMALERAAAINIAVPPLNLTSQEMQLVLRQALLPFFSNEMAQDVRMTSPYETFLPFVCGQNGVSSGMTALNAPTLFAENVRCCTRRIAKLKGGYDRTVLDLVTVLGRLSERPQLGNYTWGNGQNIYATDSTEVPVNIIDCSATVGQTVNYLDLNTKRVNDLTTAFNEWQSNLSAVLSTLVPLTPAEGSRVLLTSIYTNIQIKLEQGLTSPPAPVAGKQLEKKPSTKHIGRNVDVIKASQVQAVGGSSYFNQLADCRTASMLPIYPELMPFIRVMVLPCRTMSEETAQTNLSAQQTAFCDTTFFDRSSGNAVQTSGAAFVNVPVEDRHRQLAALDVKAIISGDQDNQLVAAVKELAAKGEGGFFARLADVIGEVTGSHFVKGAAGVFHKLNW